MEKWAIYGDRIIRNQAPASMFLARDAYKAGPPGPPVQDPTQPWGHSPQDHAEQFVSDMGDALESTLGVKKNTFFRLRGAPIRH
jgi:hypothetical protein